MKFQPVINLIGLLLCTLSAFMLIPGFVDYILGDEDWAAFLVSSFITLLLVQDYICLQRKPRTLN